MTTLASAPYLWRPFLMLVFLGVVAGLVGVIVNLRRLEFNAEATVHSVFPGIVAGAAYGGIEMIIPGAGITAVFVAIALTLAGRRGVKTSESGTAVVLTSFFSFGIVLSLAKRDMSGQLEALMFGRLLEVTESSLLESCLVCTIGLVIILASWKEQVFTAFDREGAQAAGINGLVVDLLVNCAIAAVVVSASTAVGVLLVIGYLVVPGATARLLVKRISLMIPVAIAVAVAGGYIGMHMMMIDAPHQISPQAAVALSVLALFFAALPVKMLRDKLTTGRTDTGTDNVAADITPPQPVACSAAAHGRD
ncbi:metal ABC transporter permease [Corynebacterium mendelii]|nr:metal ABC transporter permease [Corynebacterium mendelii]